MVKAQAGAGERVAVKRGRTRRGAGRWQMPDVNTIVTMQHAESNDTDSDGKLSAEEIGEMDDRDSGE